MNSSNSDFVFIYICILFPFLNFHQIICDNNSDNDNDNTDSAQTPITKSCPFSGTRYPLGESWFRRLDTHDMSYCVACNCVQGGKSNCTSKPCDGLIKLCEEATDLDSLGKGCCQQCTETKATKRVEIHVSSRVETTITTGKPSTHKISCLHNGRHYYDNQVFASNTSGIHKTEANQCVQCICQAGLVLCRLKTCFADNCSSFGSDSDGFNEDCCPLRANCRDKPISDSNSSDQKEGNFFVTIYSPNDDSSATDPAFNANDCKSGGKTHLNGAKWHPIIGPFGQMDCVVCVCNEGNVECSRISCHSFYKSSCLEPKRIQGQCCPTCADLTIDKQKNTEESEWQTKQPLIESNNNNNNNINKSENNVSNVWNKKSEENVNPICVPLRMDTIVYRSHAQSSNSAYYQYAFQTKASNRTTTLYSFTVKEGKITDFSQQYLTKEEFNVLSQSFKFKLIGATKSKFVEKFAKRTKKFPQRCSQKCKTRVERLERSLRIKEVFTNTLCDKNAFEFN